MVGSPSGLDGGLAPMAVPHQSSASRSPSPLAVSITLPPFFSQANLMSVVQCEPAPVSTLPLAARMDPAGYRLPAL